MKDKFTIEEIKAAIDRVFQSDISHKKKIITELTKPEWKPEVGQVYCHKYHLTNNYYKRQLKSNFIKCRTLTLDEHGPDVKAMQEFIQRLANLNVYDGRGQVRTAKAILKDHEIKL